MFSQKELKLKQEMKNISKCEWREQKQTFFWNEMREEMKKQGKVDFEEMKEVLMKMEENSTHKPTGIKKMKRMIDSNDDFKKMRNNFAANQIEDERKEFDWQRRFWKQKTIHITKHFNGKIALEKRKHEIMIEMKVRIENIKKLLRTLFKLFNNKDENTQQTMKMFQKKKNK